MAESRDERLLAVLLGIGETLVGIERALERLGEKGGSGAPQYVRSSRQLFAERVEQGARALAGDFRDEE